MRKKHYPSLEQLNYSLFLCEYLASRIMQIIYIRFCLSNWEGVNEYICHNARGTSIEIFFWRLASTSSLGHIYQSQKNLLLSGFYVYYFDNPFIIQGGYLEALHEFGKKIF